MNTARKTSIIAAGEYSRIADDVRLGEDVRLGSFINLYGCSIGSRTKVGAFVEIQKNAVIGEDCKISSHSFICEGVVIEDRVFIGHNVTFINDTFPRATMPDGKMKTGADWKVETTIVRSGASVGSGATILSNVVIGKDSIVGAGSIVTSDVSAGTIVAGNPARVLRRINDE
ncbi:MAG: acyltransferase [Deltaproteobacteria bacterium]|nr:acyltransferase [Deltaproteobacteria bacterium]